MIISRIKGSPKMQNNIFNKNEFKINVLECLTKNYPKVDINRKTAQVD